MKKTVTEVSFGEYKESDKSVTLRSSSASIIGGGTAYTLNSRDYKGVMLVVISKGDRPTDGEQSSGELLRTGRIQRHVCDGEEE